MDWFTPQVIMWAVSHLVVGGALWGGIRMDIKNIHKDQARQDRDMDKMDGRIVEAHQRIDRIVERRNSPQLREV